MDYVGYKIFTYIAENSVFKERSSSLKPQVLEMREPMKHPKESLVTDKQPFFSFKDEIQKDHNIRANQSYSIASKPPKNDCK